MTDSPTPSDIEQLPQAWRNLWRAHTVLPDSVASDELTIFVRAGGRDAAHLAVKRALHAMFPAAYQDLDEAYENLSSAPELVREGVSERYVDRLFEVAWTGNKVDAWVSAPVFVVPEAAALYAAWITAQLDHASHYASRAFEPAPPIVADEATPTATQRNAMAVTKNDSAPLVPVIRHGNGFLIEGVRLVIRVLPSGGVDQICVGMSATAEAIGGDRDMNLGFAERFGFNADEIRIEGDVLTCAAQAPYIARYAPGVTDYREGFSVTLEPGQAGAVRQAVGLLRPVLAGYRAVLDHLRPWFDLLPEPWHVQEPVFHLVMARVLDGADQDAAMAAFDEAAENCLPGLGPAWKPRRFGRLSMMPSTVRAKRCDRECSMKDLTKNAAVLAVLQEAMAKLETIGLKCMALPNDLPGYGASVSLHAGEDDMAVTAAYVANQRGSEFAHLADEDARKGFAREVSELVVARRHFDDGSSTS